MADFLPPRSAAGSSQITVVWVETALSFSERALHIEHCLELFIEFVLLMLNRGHSKYSHSYVKKPLSLFLSLVQNKKNGLMNGEMEAHAQRAFTYLQP